MLHGESSKRLATPRNDRITYHQPNRPSRHTSQTKHKALPEGKPGRRITPINTAAVRASAQQQPTISTHTRQGHHQIFSANTARYEPISTFRRLARRRAAAGGFCRVGRAAGVEGGPAGGRGGMRAHRWTRGRTGGHRCTRPQPQRPATACGIRNTGSGYRTVSYPNTAALASGPCPRWLLTDVLNWFPSRAGRPDYPFNPHPPPSPFPDRECWSRRVLACVGYRPLDGLLAGVTHRPGDYITLWSPSWTLEGFTTELQYILYHNITPGGAMPQIQT